MDLQHKIVNALSEALEPEYVRLDDDGISGFVVSRRFEGMSSLDRQERIEDALSKASLTQAERRQVVMIAGLTPDEYEAVGARIRVPRIKATAGGAVEVLVEGGLSDATYVGERSTIRRGSRQLSRSRSAALGVSMSFRAKGTEADPLTKAKAIRVLKKDPYIEVMTNA